METKIKKVKQNIFRLVLCVGALAVIWGGYLFVMRGIYRSIQPCEDDFSWVYQVDSVTVEGDEFVLTGFAFELGKDAEKKAYDIVLQDIETGKNYFPKMQYSERKDVNEYFLCEYDYLNSGFTARIKSKKLDLQNGNYEVILQIGDRSKAYHTRTYLSRGKLMYVNPKEYVPLEVVGTDLEEIVENGVLRVYRPDLGMYVYQYEGDLFWVVQKEHRFMNAETNIEVHVETTQCFNLPEEMQKQNSNVDNIGFSFTRQEIFDWNAGIYRVAKCKVPVDYAITEIRTGEYDTDWTWIQSFRPHYIFAGKVE